MDLIINSGYFIFEFDQDSEVQLFLEYVSMSSRRPSKLGHCEQKEETKTEKWKFEKIQDFQSRLGFLDTREEGHLGEKLQHFKYITEVSITMCLRPHRQCIIET